MSPASRRAAVDPRLAALAATVPRTRAYLRRRQDSRLGLGVQVLLDEVVLAVLRNPALFPDDEDIVIAGAEAHAAHAFYSERGWLDDPKGYHQDPVVPDARIWMTRTSGRHHDKMTFPVDHSPHTAEPGRERWLAHEHHRTARASLLRHREPGHPWLICVHGFSMGELAMDMRVFRAGRFHDQLGINLAFPVLPSHGERRGVGMRTGEGFTSVNIVDGIHGVAQSVWEIRSLIRWIRQNDPGSSIGIHGISLGGCVAALVASLEPDLACVIGSIPVADLFELYRRNSPAPTLVRSDQTGATGPIAEAVARVVSPLAVAPLVPHGGRYLIAGLGDRMSTTAQAERLWQHWDMPAAHWFPGGHVGYFLTRSAARAVEDAVQNSLISS